MKRFNKMLTIILAMCLLFSSTPGGYVSAYAGEMETEHADSKTVYYSDIEHAYKAMNRASWSLFGASVLATLGCTCVGIAVAGVGGGILLMAVGFLAFYMIRGWNTSCDLACMDIKNLQKKGKTSCQVTYEFYGFSLYISVS